MNSEITIIKYGVVTLKYEAYSYSFFLYKVSIELPVERPYKYNSAIHNENRFYLLVWLQNSDSRVGYLLNAVSRF